MRQRLTRAATVSLILMVGALAACDITQQHIDEASERLAEATVATGSPPTAEQIAEAGPLRFEDLAGSSWRFVEMSKWPDADWVVTLGSNGRVVWHVGPNRLTDTTHWRVQGSRFTVGDGANWRGEHQAVRVDADRACLEFQGTACWGVFQRVSP